jgi:hypothetical protein
MLTGFDAIFNTGFDAIFNTGFDAILIQDLMIVL